MARKKIREYDSKRLLKAHILRLKNIKLPLNVTQVSSDSGLNPIIQMKDRHGPISMPCYRLDLGTQQVNYVCTGDLQSNAGSSALTPIPVHETRGRRYPSCSAAQT